MEQQEKELQQKEKQEKGKSILGVISDVLLIIIIIIAICITVMTFTSKSSETGIGNILGYIPFSVESDSMSPNIKQGSLIISKEVKVEDARTGKGLKVGDVITFRDFQDVKRNGTTTVEPFFNTHRIIEIKKDKNGQVEYYKTKGDQSTSPDENGVIPDEIISKQVGASAESIDQKTLKPVGVKRGFVISNLGKVLDFLQTQLGFMVCVIIPLALFFIWQVYRLIAMFLSAKQDDVSDEIKQKAIEEYLAKQEAEKKAAAEAEENK